MLQIKDLHVEIAGNEVLKGVNLHIKPGETFILFGPNGSGKTTLLMTLMGFADYKITKGSIVFKGRDVTRAPMYERARLGLGMSFQRPPTIHGLPVRTLLEMCAKVGQASSSAGAQAAEASDSEAMDLDALARRVNFERFLGRDVNAGFSGGEIKRSEMLQLMAQKPDLLLFDEPESGVDLENMAVIGQAARRLLGGECEDGAEDCPKRQTMKSGKSGLIITHTGYILDYVNADRGQVMYEGQLCCEARPLEILEHVRKFGYQECLRCFMDEKQTIALNLPR
ncbi:MAG: ABC transporter ATP-binding protein [Deltaproteobacteria bacterium]|jgi:Fe-S cluster assembly ATP-binding protein|nr:ABC transporter ATP-binding protein [Deltaproteobacteria bacterium]